MDPALLDRFGLDPDVLHLNHGAFGVAPTAVRHAAAAWRETAERNPHRFNRVELATLVPQARARAADFLGLPAEECGWVRNVSEGVSAVLGSLDLRPGDELVTSNHGYGAVRMALEHHARRRGATVREAGFAVGAPTEEVVDAYAAACSSRTRLVVVDQITSPTATVLPVAAVAAAVAPTGAPVLVDAAHVPGSLRTDVAALGASYWVGNLHKWAYTPRGAALLWCRPGAEVAPTVLSWQQQDGYAEAFDHPGTWDYAAWLAVGEGLDFWAGLGGWDRVEAMGRCVAAGQETVAQALGTSLAGLPASPAPTMRLVRLPAGVAATAEQADALYERLSTEQRVEAAVVAFDGSGYVRLAAGPYTTHDDYDRLAVALGATLEG